MPFVGIPTERIIHCSAEQEGDYWCWAACVKMALALHSLPVAQADVVRAIQGHSWFGFAPDDRGATDEEMSLALRLPVLTGAGSVVSNCGYSLGPPTARLVIDGLNLWLPFIVKVRARSTWHAVLLHGVEVEQDEQPSKAFFFDPSPHSWGSPLPNGGKLCIASWGESMRCVAAHWVLGTPRVSA